MKQNEFLIERKQQRTVIMYHGTVLSNVRSILKHGLVANPPNRVYDDGVFQTIGGIYLTSSFHTAEDAADVASEKFKSPPVVVTVQYVQDSGFIDEDIFHQHVSAGISYAHKYGSSYSNAIFHHLTRKNNGLKFSKQTIHLIKDYADYVEDLINVTGKRNIYTLSTTEGYRDQLKIVLKAIKSSDIKAASEVWLDRDIKFSGKTRILKITNMQDHTLIYSEKKQTAPTQQYAIFNIGGDDILIDIPEHITLDTLENYFYTFKKTYEKMNKGKDLVNSYRPRIYTAANMEVQKKINMNNNMSEQSFTLKDGKIYA